MIAQNSISCLVESAVRECVFRSHAELDQPLGRQQRRGLVAPDRDASADRPRAERLPVIEPVFVLGMNAARRRIP